MKKSAPEILCDAATPLRLVEWRERADFWRRLGEGVKKFRTSQSFLDDLDNKTSMNGMTGLAGKDVFREIIGVCGNGQTYLHKILAHLQILHSVVPNGGYTAVCCFGWYVMLLICG